MRSAVKITGKVGSYMKIQDFCDMNKFEQIMKNWANSTGLATVAVGADGKYISDCYNFTEFCIDLTRGSAEGKKRCEQCDREGHGVYPCHAGLVDFGIPITLEDGTVLGSIIGGQVLPENPDEEKFRQTARELGIDEDKYIKALKKVNVKTREQTRTGAECRRQHAADLAFLDGIHNVHDSKHAHGHVHCRRDPFADRFCVECAAGRIFQFLFAEECVAVGISHHFFFTSK